MKNKPQDSNVGTVSARLAQTEADRRAGLYQDGLEAGRHWAQEHAEEWELADVGEILSALATGSGLLEVSLKHDDAEGPLTMARYLVDHQDFTQFGDTIRVKVDDPVMVGFLTGAQEVWEEVLAHRAI